MKMKLLLLFLIGMAYWKCLPTTVQSLDTGELVSSAYQLTVAHPPGFPLFVWSQFVFTHLFVIGTVFWRASFLTSLWSLAGLSFLSKLSNGWVFLMSCLFPLAFSKGYWKYSVLPDVFMLNILLQSLVQWVYFKLPVSQKRSLLLCFFFALGLATHPTTIFLLPMVFHASFESRSRRAIVVGAVSVFVIVLFAYSSLLFLHTDSLYSWGSLQSLADVIHHGLRKDYGVFSLSGKSEIANFLENAKSLFLVLLESSLALIFAMIPLGLKLFGLRNPGVRYWIGLGIGVLYAFVFVFLANVSSQSILERFFLFPLVLVMGLAGVGLTSVEQQLGLRGRVVITCLGIAFAVWNLNCNWREIAFSRNTIIEDYAKNLLNMSVEGRPTALIVDGDTRCHALQYVQSVEGYHPEVLVLCLGKLFDPSHLNKITPLWPSFQLRSGWSEEKPPRDVFRNVVQPNIQKFDFIFTGGVNPQDYLVTFAGLGRRVSQGIGVTLDEDSLKRIVRYDVVPMDLFVGEFHELKSLYSEYAYYYLKAGQMAANRKVAMQYFQKAIEIVPYCIPAKINICQLIKESGEDVSECMLQLAKLRASEVNYY